METVNVHEARIHPSRLLERVVHGEEVIIARAGKPIARLVGDHAEDQDRTGGHWKGLVRIGDDFDDPLPDEVAGPFSAPP